MIKFTVGFILALSFQAANAAGNKVSAAKSAEVSGTKSAEARASTEDSEEAAYNEDMLAQPAQSSVAQSADPTELAAPLVPATSQLTGENSIVSKAEKDIVVQLEPVKKEHAAEAR